PARLTASFHPYAHFHSPCRQFTIEFLRFLAVLQSPLSAVAGGGHHKSNVLVGRVIIASYNQHIGSFLPSLFGWFAHHQTLLGSTEPTLSWNQLHTLRTHRIAAPFRAFRTANSAELATGP